MIGDDAAKKNALNLFDISDVATALIKG